jgi:hypothetical protein
MTQHLAESLETLRRAQEQNASSGALIPSMPPPQTAAAPVATHQSLDFSVTFKPLAIDLEEVKTLDKSGREGFLKLMYSWLASLEEERKMAHQMVNVMQRSQSVASCDPQLGLMAGAVIQKLAENQLKIIKEISSAMKLLGEIKLQWEMIDRSLETTQESASDMFARVAEAQGIEAEGFNINDLPPELKSEIKADTDEEEI